MDAVIPDASRNLSYVPSGSVGGRLGSIDVTEWGYDDAPADERPVPGQPNDVETGGRDVPGMTPERIAAGIARGKSGGRVD